MRMATQTRRAEEGFPSNGVGCPSPLHTQKRQKICKLLRSTKIGQEPLNSQNNNPVAVMFDTYRRNPVL